MYLGDSHIVLKFNDTLDLWFIIGFCYFALTCLFFALWGDELEGHDRRFLYAALLAIPWPLVLVFGFCLILYQANKQGKLLPRPIQDALDERKEKRGGWS